MLKISLPGSGARGSAAPGVAVQRAGVEALDESHVVGRQERAEQAGHEVGPGHLAAILSIVPHQARTPQYYRNKLAGFKILSHVTIEVTPPDAS